MASLKLTSCCGLGEAAGLSYPQDSSFKTQMRAILKGKKLLARYMNYYTGAFQRFHLRKGAVIFTSNTLERGNYASTFASNITRARLGTVQKFKPFTNPNTDNPITVYLWTINQEALIQWVKSNGMEEIITER